MNILAFDCSGQTMACAVAQGETVLASAYAAESRNHAPGLAPMIQSCMQAANLTFDELELIAVTVGPGSFTGLRIGVATAKGLADTLHKPLLGLGSLDALALNLAGEVALLVPMLDARKGQVYCAVYDNTAGDMKRVAEAAPRTPTEELSPLLAAVGQIVFCGEALPLWRDQIAAYYGPRARFAESGGIRGEALIRLAAAAPASSYTEDLTPVYLRGVDAKPRFGGGGA